MKFSLVLLLITFTFISNHQMIDKLINKGHYNTKKDTLRIIGNLLFDNGYEPAFVAGVLGNIFHEAQIGKFESSAYDKHPELKPDYLKYMDDNYKYREKYSGKIITQVSLRELGTLLDKLKKDNWKKGKFGLGCVQWTGSRTYDLYNVYNRECGNCDKITLSQATSSEGKLVISELKGSSYSYIYTQWKRNHPNMNTPQAAYDAGYEITMKYEVPKDTKTKAKERATTAQNMYTDMTS